MTALDKVLAALDAGLQSSDEQGYPERIDDVTKCARCLRHEHAADAELCSGCRAWMLGDSDVDPRREGITVTPDGQVHGWWQRDQPPRPQGMAVHHRNGDARDNSPENLELVPISENVTRPAAYRVASSIAVPEWYHVTCDRCGAGYACDPERTIEAARIIGAAGHGLGWTCDPLTRTRAASGPAESPYDWQREREDSARMTRRW